MPRPQTAVDRFLAREGWFFLGWTVNRRMVRLHDRVGWTFLGAAPVASALMAIFVEPKGAVIGASLAVIGAVHLGIFNWVKRQPDIREEPAPKLSHEARRFLKRVVKSSVGTDPLGQKYYGRILKPSATDVKLPISELINPTAFDAFEKAAEAYNRLVGLCTTDLENQSHLLKTAHEAMPVILDFIAKVDSFPEQASVIQPRIDQMVNQLNSLSNQIEPPESEAENSLAERIAALQQLNSDESSLNRESLKQGN